VAEDCVGAPPAPPEAVTALRLFQGGKRVLHRKCRIHLPPPRETFIFPSDPQMAISEAPEPHDPSYQTITYRSRHFRKRLSRSQTTAPDTNTVDFGRSRDGVHRCRDRRLLGNVDADHMPDRTPISDPDRLRSGWLSAIKHLQVDCTDAGQPPKSGGQSASVQQVTTDLPDGHVAQVLSRRYSPYADCRAETVGSQRDWRLA
jgi:hypothetical protein